MSIKRNICLVQGITKKLHVSVLNYFDDIFLYSRITECYNFFNPEGRVLDSRWCHWNFSLI